ncbi:hypothetical protein HYW76_03335 [Candidatus Pacearchaeota archaeon]|nr:hypothetical protein [Candidatus Pacearchaeota archaeon]
MKMIRILVVGIVAIIILGGFLLIKSFTGNTIINNKELNGTEILILKVSIPCPGHAGLIMRELEKINGVVKEVFIMPNMFKVYYNPEETSQEEILNLDIFKEYSAEIVK